MDKAWLRLYKTHLLLVNLISLLLDLYQANFNKQNEID